jgi:hypothetical protein
VAKIDEFFDLAKQISEIIMPRLLVDIFYPLDHPVGPGGQVSLTNGQ